MKVGFDAMLLSRCRSGVEFSIRNLAAALSQHGTCRYRVYLPAQSDAGLAGGPNMDIRRTRIVGSVRLLRLAWEQCLLPALARRDGCELLHAPGYIAPLASRVPVVLTVYDVMALTQPHWCRPANRANYGIMLPAGIRRAAAVIVPSRFTAAEIERTIPGAGAKVRVIPLAVDDRLREAPDVAASERARQRLGLPDRYILFVGREEPKKNIPLLLDVFSRLKRERGIPHKLVIVGPKGADSAAVEDTVRRLGLSEEVFRYGFVSHDELTIVYRLADLFVFLSLYEGFGLPPLEAMACGTPVVCSTRGALPEVVGRAALCVDPADRSAAGDAIVAALNDDSLRADLVARGRNQAALTSWSDIVGSTENLYRSAARPGLGNVKR